MKYTSVDQVQIGQWVTMCCELDLFQITEDELPDVRDWVVGQLEDGDPFHYEWWEDERSALLELRTRYDPSQVEAIAEIDVQIAG